MKLYIDSVSKYSTSSGTLTTSQALTAGTHSLAVNAWTNTGSVFSAKESINVTSGSSTPSVSVSPSSASVAPGGTVQFKANVSNSTSTSVTWSVDGTTGGTATVGTISTSGLYAAPSAAGTHTVTATLSSNTSVKGSATVTVGTPTTSTQSMYTYKYSNLRAGLNSHETKLTTANVNANTFGKLGSWSLDGSIFTEPLYVTGVATSSGTRNIVYVGTENDSVYAIDADRPGTVIWKKSLLTSTATIGKAYVLSSDGRTSLGSNIGITGTPVIDPSTRRLYVVGRTTENNAQVHRLYALDIASGNIVDKSNAFAASVGGTGDGSSSGRISFNNLTHNQRPGLLLVNGVIYVGFASFSDYRPYHGWVLAYSASSLDFISAFNTTPNTSGGGIWQSGAAPAADSDGNIYLATGNQMPYNITTLTLPSEMTNSVFKLRLVGNNLTLIDYFTPYNSKCLTNDDLDVASSAIALIPDQIGGRNLMTVASKEGRAYLLNRDSMGHYNSSGDTQIPSSVLYNSAACGQSGFNANSPQRTYGQLAYWNGFVYFAGIGGPLRQYRVSNGTFQKGAVSSFTWAINGQVGRGPIPVISANGTSNGIVWTAENNLSGQGYLRAFNASNLTQMFSSNYGAGSNFITPTVINGKVFVSGKNILYVYGLK